MVAVARWCWLLVALGGCLSDDKVEVGDVAWASLPTNVVAGEDFTVVVTTQGSPCDSPASTDVAIHGTTVDITPYDNIDQGGCILSLQYYMHSVVVSLDVPGPGEVRVHTLRGGSTPDVFTYPIAVE